MGEWKSGKIPGGVRVPGDSGGVGAGDILGRVEAGDVGNWQGVGGGGVYSKKEGRVEGVGGHSGGGGFRGRVSDAESTGAGRWA